MICDWLKKKSGVEPQPVSFSGISAVLDERSRVISFSGSFLGDFSLSCRLMFVIGASSYTLSKYSHAQVESEHISMSYTVGRQSIIHV